MFNQAINRRGFTLMEILVGVLIIGVLTAVAVPMYKHATLKSTFSTVMPPTQSLAAAQEIFFLNTGEYAQDKEALDVAAPDTAKTSITVSDKRNYKYVMGHHTGVPGANYVVYQNRSKRFAGNIHCEALKTDDQANWLCEKGLGGTLLTGSISGTNYQTYLLSGDAGTDKFLREDCPEGYYDDNGTCQKVNVGRYAEEGELKLCSVGSYQSQQGQTSCDICPAGKVQPYEGRSFCYDCNIGSYSDVEGGTACQLCPPGTYQDEYGQTSCKPCPAGKYRRYTNGSSCDTCPSGYYADAEGSTVCTKCPTGQTSNEGHTGCVPA